MHKVFVYGTLKEGHGNDVLLSFSKKIGEGFTKERYVMYESGIPFVSKSLALTKIYGEVYLVTDDTLDSLDMLEGHPDWYKREEVPIIYNNDIKKGLLTNAWLYFSDAAPGNSKINKDGIYRKNYRFSRESF
jgi:gamma-glutamylaminecyclotransferase